MKVKLKISPSFSHAAAPGGLPRPGPGRGSYVRTKKLSFFLSKLKISTIEIIYEGSRTLSGGEISKGGVVMHKVRQESNIIWDWIEGRRVEEGKNGGVTRFGYDMRLKRSIPWLVIEKITGECMKWKGGRKIFDKTLWFATSERVISSTALVPLRRDIWI